MSDEVWENMKPASLYHASSYGCVSLGVGKELHYLGSFPIITPESGKSPRFPIFDSKYHCHAVVGPHHNCDRQSVYPKVLSKKWARKVMAILTAIFRDSLSELTLSVVYVVEFSFQTTLSTGNVISSFLQERVPVAHDTQIFCPWHPASFSNRQQRQADTSQG